MLFGGLPGAGKIVFSGFLAIKMKQIADACPAKRRTTTPGPEAREVGAATSMRIGVDGRPPHPGMPTLLGGPRSNARVDSAA